MVKAGMELVNVWRKGDYADFSLRQGSGEGGIGT
jgi:hypothetical protein